MRQASDRAEPAPRPLPSGASAHVGLALVSSLATATVLLLFQPLALSIYDESIILTGAMHVANGEVPGVDFYTVYGPLQFYVVSLLFALFDDNVLAVRVFYAFTLAVPLVLLTRLLTPLRSSAELCLSLAYLTLMIVFCSRYAASAYPNHSLLPICVGIVYLKRSSLERAHAPLFVLLLSALLSAALLLRPTVGMVLVLTMFAALPFEIIESNGPLRRRLLEALGPLAAAIATAAATVAIVDRLGGGAFLGVLDIITTIQKDVYADMRALPFPALGEGLAGLVSLDFVSAYAPLIAIGAGAVAYLLALTKAVDSTASDRTTLLWLLAMSCLLYTLGLLRTDGAHLLPAIVLSSSIGAFLVRMHIATLRRDVPLTVWRTAMLACALVFTVGSVLVFAYHGTAVRPTLATACEWQDIGTARRACLDVSDEQERALDFLARHLGKEERIFSANARHDRIYVNNMAYYALSGHLPITYWAHMDPGVQTSEPVQREMIDELEEYALGHGRSIVVIEQPPLPDEPNASARSSGVHLLDTYLDGCARTFAAGAVEIRTCGKRSFAHRK